jgi:hypothetical protein
VVKKDSKKEDSKQKGRKEVSMSRIMSYYSPKGVVVVSIIVSFINAWTFPMYGLLFSKILFTLLMPDAPTY